MAPPRLPPRTCPVCVLTAALLLLLLQVALCQKLPSRKQDPLSSQNFPEILYDFRIIPDGTEVSTYLYKHKSKSYSFAVDEPGTPFSITVTACSSAVSWNVTLEPTEEHSGYGRDADGSDELWEQRRLMAPPDEIRQVASFPRSYVDTYITSSAPGGVYAITLMALDYDTTVHLLASTAPALDAAAYPDLPDDPNVHVLSEGRQGVMLQWKPSPSATRREQRVHYCLAVNSHANYHSRCEALAHAYGDVAPTAPPHAGFGFEWERQRPEEHRLRPRPGASHYVCIGTKTQYLYTNVQHGRTYYFDVFAVESTSNRSVAYNGTSLMYTWRRRDTALKDGKVLQVFMKASTVAKMFSYTLDTNAKQLIVNFQMCFGDIMVLIYKNGDLIKKARVRNYKEIVIAPAARGVYFIRVQGRRQRARSFRISIASGRGQDPYPELPRDTSLRVYDNVSTCSSVTIAWLATPTRQQYCVYQRRIAATRARRLRSATNKCYMSPSRRKWDKVSCRFYKARNRRKQVVVQRIRGLAPGRTYALSVAVTKPGGQTLAYQTAMASTRRRCS